MARIVDLKGKYYGTAVEFVIEGQRSQVDIWVRGTEPSERELADKPDGMDVWEWVDGSHYESKESYQIAQLIADTLTANGY